MPSMTSTDNTINRRIDRLIRELGLNKSGFSRRIDVHPTVIGNIVSGRESKPSFEVLYRILVEFERVNATWLVKGEGEIFSDQDPYEQLKIEMDLQLEKCRQENINLKKELLLKDDLLKTKEEVIRLMRKE